MKDVMGLIYTGENDARLRELTVTRAIAAMPVAGRYRVIDFLVSSMVNGGMKNIGVITQKNYHSLMDHLGSGKEWDLHGKNDGLHILPPFLTRENVGLYPGLLDALRSNSNFFVRSKQETLVLSNSNIIYNAHLDELVQYYRDTNADITLLYTTDPGMKRDEYGTYLAIDKSGNVTDVEVQPTHPGYDNVFMQVMVIKRELIKDMDILDPAMRKGLFRDDLPVYTKVRDEMPACYGDDSTVINSLVADGCQIEGTVENSVLFRGVKIAAGAHVKNCIIMQDGQAHEGAYIENCILDKQAVIKRNAKLIGPEAYPIVIGKDVVI